MDETSQRAETQLYNTNLDRTLKELQQAVGHQEAELIVVRFLHPCHGYSFTNFQT